MAATKLKLLLCRSVKVNNKETPKLVFGDNLRVNSAHRHCKIQQSDFA